MTFFEWLTTQTGIEFTHAVILVLVAIAAYINHRATVKVDQKLDGHIASVARHSAQTGSTEPEPQ
jgi:hypothetical protein